MVLKDNRVRERNDATMVQVPDALPVATRYLSEAAASLAAGAVPAVGFPIDVPALALASEAANASAPSTASPRNGTATGPTFTEAGVQAAGLLSNGAARVAHATPIVAPAAPLIALPVNQP